MLGVLTQLATRWRAGVVSSPIYSQVKNCQPPTMQSPPRLISISSGQLHICPGAKAKGVRLPHMGCYLAANARGKNARLRAREVCAVRLQPVHRPRKVAPGRCADLLARGNGVPQIAKPRVVRLVAMERIVHTELWDYLLTQQTKPTLAHAYQRGTKAQQHDQCVNRAHVMDRIRRVSPFRTNVCIMKTRANA